MQAVYLDHDGDHLEAPPGRPHRLSVGDSSLYTDSALRARWPGRAFESEPGVLASLKPERSVEVKHGRICMLANMGYIVPRGTGNFPG